MALPANSWICCPQLPYHPSKNGTHSTCFSSTRGHSDTPKQFAPKLPESRGERIWFHGQPNLSPIFREISCAHFSWKSKDENRRKISPFFRRMFRPCRRKISPEFRSRGFSEQQEFHLLRVATQRCRHWQRGMAIANANANAAMRCTKLSDKRYVGPVGVLLTRLSPSTVGSADWFQEWLLGPLSRKLLWIFQQNSPKNLFGLFLTFSGYFSILQGYFWRPSRNTL